MKQKLCIRQEHTSDIQAINDVTIAAFKDHPHSNQTEHHIIGKLRDDNALVISSD